MNENLADLIKGMEELHVSPQEEIEEKNISTETEITQQSPIAATNPMFFSISLTLCPLNIWLEKNQIFFKYLQGFEEYGIKEDCHILFPLRQNETDDIFLFKNIFQMKMVQNYPVSQFRIYPVSQVFHTEYKITDDLILRTYTIRKKTIFVLCLVIENEIFYPFIKKVLKSPTQELKFIIPSHFMTLRNNLNATLERKSDFLIWYPLIKPHLEKINTELDVLRYFSNIQNNTVDLNQQNRIERLLLYLSAKKLEENIINENK